MADHHFYMLFGAAIAFLGFLLARSSQSGTGQTTIRIFGGEFSLAAAGGVVVMMFGIVAFSLPKLLDGGNAVEPPADRESPLTNALMDLPSAQAEESPPTSPPTSSPQPQPGAPSPDAAIRITGPRTQASSTIRQETGWLTDAPSYRLTIEPGLMPYDARSTTDEGCLNKILAAYTAKGIKVDYAKSSELMFATERFLIDIWCHDGRATYMVAGPQGSEIDAIRDRIGALVQTALSDPPAP